MASGVVVNGYDGSQRPKRLTQILAKYKTTGTHAAIYLTNPDSVLEAPLIINNHSTGLYRVKQRRSITPSKTLVETPLKAY